MKYVKGEFEPKNPNKWLITTESLGGANITYRSSFELRFYEWCDCSDIVRFVSVEPFSIPYMGCDGKQHRYFPDVLLKMISGLKVLIEIKPYDKVAGNVKKNFDYFRNQKKWEAAKYLCNKFGMIFCIITERELNSNLDEIFKRLMLEKDNESRN